MNDCLYREEVLDHGFVELIDVMPNEVSECKKCINNGMMSSETYHEGEGYFEKCTFCGGKHWFPRDLAIVNAARTSYLGESKGIESDKKLLKYLYKNRHTTPFEMVEFKFRVKAPVLVWWQWVRHRTWSYNLQSGRYTEYEDEFYIPNEWRLQDNKNKQGSSSEFIEFTNVTSDDFGGKEERHISSMFNSMTQRCLEIYKDLLESGVAKEQARLVLPAFSLYHVGIVKVNAKNLLDFLRLRNHDHAQWEIQQYAKAIEKMFAQILPWTYEAFAEERNNK